MSNFFKTARAVLCAALLFQGTRAIGADIAAADTSAAGGASAPAVKVLDSTPDAATQPTTQPLDVAPVAPIIKAPHVTATDAGTFSIQINDGTSLVEVLRLIGNTSQMSIIPSKEARGTLPAMDLYNVTMHEALDAILQPNGLVYTQKGNFIYVSTTKEAADAAKAGRVMSTAIYHLFYTPVDNAMAMIKPALSADAIVAQSNKATVGIDTASASGGATASGGLSDEGGNSHATDDMIVVTDYPDHLDAVARIIKEIDQRPKEVLVEATILQATLSENNQFGIDFAVLGGVDFAGLSTNAAGTTGTGTTGGTTGSTGSTSNVNPVSTPLTGLGTGQNPPTNKFGAGQTNFPMSSGGLQVGIIHNGLGVFMSALESVNNTVVLANPKVLALNKQQGMVHVGDSLGYQTTTVSSTTSTQTVQFLETGTKLAFRPFIGDDGYIRMEIHPEDSTGNLNAANLPQEQITELTTNVMVKDGHTIVIGGLFREVGNTGREQVPLLGNIPLLGALFRNQQDSTTRQELIILLTPHIVKDEEAYSKSSVEELKEAERLRVGVRQGMMWFGRERLADGEYEAAIADTRKTPPDIQGALWHLDCATNLNPTFIEAIDLKEKLSGKTVTAADNSTIRSFVERQILLDPADVSMPKPDATTHTSGQPTPIGPLAPLQASITTQPADATITAATTQPSVTITANAPMSLNGSKDVASATTRPVTADTSAGNAIATPAPAEATPTIVVLPDVDGTVATGLPTTHPTSEPTGSAQIDTSETPFGGR
jgi:type IV pilus secretin PilQ/predicted competence protein